jgi:tryptophanase
VKPPFEGYKAKVVEPIPWTTPEYRKEALERCAYNLFKLRSDEVTIDLLTDSGTGAMSQNQWAALFHGDEAYAGARSFYRFEKVVRSITGYREIIPTHQGRAAEHILFRLLAGPDKVVISNTLFDTTRAHVEDSGAVGLDLPCPESLGLYRADPFKGNIDITRLEQVLDELGRSRLGLVIVTVTNNSAGGQPVSMSNLREASRLCRERGVPFFLDACRFAENCYLIQQREPGYLDRRPAEIAGEMFQLADGCTMSAKKDGLANIGGFIALNDPDLANKARDLVTLYEGFPTYGGLAGRDLEAISVGLGEALDEGYLADRIATVSFLGTELAKRGVPLVRPFGGHAIYIDGRAFLPHLPPEAYPAQSLACALYREGGIRSVEVGNVMMGKEGKPAPFDLLRLAIPRRVYSRAQLNYVAEIAGHLLERREEIPGLRIIERPEVLPHFGARFSVLSKRPIEATIP